MSRSWRPPPSPFRFVTPARRRAMETSPETTSSASVDRVTATAGHSSGPIVDDNFRFATTSAAQLAPVSIASIPKPLQRLANELDALWGDGDGQLSVAEVDRVAKYVLAALPFFTSEAGAILELADALGFTKDPGANATLSSIRKGLDALDQQEVTDGKPYRAFLDAAIAEADRRGSPANIRDAAAHNPTYHRLSILEHTAASVLAIRTFAQVAGVDWTQAGAVMLLHDVGKILRRNKSAWTSRLSGGQEKDWNFSGHEHLGADWLRARGVDANFEWHVRHHGDLRQMSRAELDTLLRAPKRTLQEFFLVSLADLLAKGNSPALVASAAQTKPRFAALAKAADLDFHALWSAYEDARTQWF